MRVLQLHVNSAFVPIDRTAPLCRRFVPEPEDELLNECAVRKTPEALFPPRKNRGTIVKERYTHARDRGVMLLQTDGACLNSGQLERGPRAGSAYVYGPPNPHKPNDTGVSATKLPPEDATSNRAELIAVITWVRARIWWGEGFHTVVVATDSEYVVNGATEWCRTWEGRGWKTSTRKPVKNKDLWEELVWNIEWVRHWGCEVLFWQIPREWNGKADAAAKSAAARN